jgi:hypothetical protein
MRLIARISDVKTWRKISQLAYLCALALGLLPLVECEIGLAFGAGGGQVGVAVWGRKIRWISGFRRGLSRAAGPGEDDVGPASDLGDANQEVVRAQVELVRRAVQTLSQVLLSL